MAEEKKTAPKQKKAPAKKPDNKKADNKKAEKKTAPKSDNKKADNKKADSKKADNKKTDSKAPAKAEKFLEYKGKPLVRSGNTVYYGDMNDPYVVCLNIKSTTDLKDIKLSQDVAIQLISTDDTLSPKERIIKNSEKKGFFNALDLGAAWLERQLKKG